MTIKPFARTANGMLLISLKPKRRMGESHLDSVRDQVGVEGNLQVSTGCKEPEGNDSRCRSRNR